MTTIYVKGCVGKDEKYYFTDGANFVSNDFTFKSTLDRIKFLGSIGINIDFSRSNIDWMGYL
jgi:hypothetical protein